ncbi:MAG TPA: phage holin family protein, partial [Calditrichaeota bacterium]|nr:phage holin family protein [Calditrichota bacterium]
NMIIRWVINAAALWFVDVLFDGIWFDSIQSLLITAIVFGVLNTVIKPILVIFTLPINILTLGLFTLVINAFILRLTDYWVDSFHTSGFGVALIAAIFISIVSVVLQNIFREE